MALKSTPARTKDLAEHDSFPITKSEMCYVLGYSSHSGTIFNNLTGAVANHKLEPVGKVGISEQFHFGDLIRAMFKDATGGSVRDRKDLAIAQKAEAETAILEKRWRPAEEMEETFSAFGEYLAGLLKDLREIPEDDRRRIFERFQQMAQDFKDAGDES